VETLNGNILKNDQWKLAKKRIEILVPLKSVGSLLLTSVETRLDFSYATAGIK